MQVKNYIQQRCICKIWQQFRKNANNLFRLVLIWLKIHSVAIRKKKLCFSFGHFFTRTFTYMVSKNNVFLYSALQFQYFYCTDVSGSEKYRFCYFNCSILQQKKWFVSVLKIFLFWTVFFGSQKQFFFSFFGTLFPAI